MYDIGDIIEAVSIDKEYQVFMLVHKSKDEYWDILNLDNGVISSWFLATPNPFWAYRKLA